MRIRVLGVAVLAAVLLAIPASALAKGASAATIHGPGLATPITLRGGGEPGSGTRLAELSEQAGLFAAMFGEADQGQVLSGRPGGALGPRYTVSYTVPVDQGSVELRQDLYPYAPGGPVSYTRPGQPLWSGEQAVGGWFRAPATLSAVLTSLGLPARPPAGAAEAAEPARPAEAAPQARAASAAAAPAGDPPVAGWVWVAAALAGGALLAGVLGVVARRHRRT
jgi:hypothetical protein